MFDKPMVLLLDTLKDGLKCTPEYFMIKKNQTTKLIQNG